MNRIETVGETLRAALEAIARISPAFIVALLDVGWDERYGRKVETVASWMNTLPEVEILHLVWDQQYTATSVVHRSAFASG